MATKRTTIVDERLIGTRVQLHPATDRWMMGDQYGEIVRIGSKLVYVKLDKSGKTIGFTPDLLFEDRHAEYLTH